MKSLKMIAAIPAMSIPVIIVSYRNHEDVAECLEALGSLIPKPTFDVYICENGGGAAFDTLIAALSKAGGPCAIASGIEFRGEEAPRFARVRPLQLRGREARVFVAEATGNLGYAGAINAWLRVLLTGSSWPGVWILNPDTQPKPHALAELVAWSAVRQRGMVGCRAIPFSSADHCINRGLRWRRILSSTAGVDKGKRNTVEPDPDELETRLHAPSGASMYVTRQCLETIGLMDERYFLYFEDLDWGYRAKKAFGVGYAHRSVVVHHVGTTIGSSTGRSRASELSVYLDFRNRIIFVRQHHRLWIVWTLLILFLRGFEYGMEGGFSNLRAALKGIYAGITGETGRPDTVFDFDRQPPRLRKSRKETRGNKNRKCARYARAKQRGKIVVSLAFFLITAAVRLLRRLAGRPAKERLVILYYHSVPRTDRAKFARQLDLLATHSTVVKADHHGAALPRTHCVAITFDDAFTSVLDNAVPELRARGMPATIFVPIGCLGRAGCWEMEDGYDPEAVASASALHSSISDLVCLGAHSLTHPRLNSLPEEEARREIAGCREQMRELLGVDPRMFAFPYGGHDGASVKLCRAAGYERVFTNLPKVVDPASNEFVRGRVPVDPTDGPIEFYLKISGAYSWMPCISVLKNWFKAASTRGNDRSAISSLHRLT